jgi:hypothetical protein
MLAIVTLSRVLNWTTFAAVRPEQNELEKMKIATWNVNGIRARQQQVCEWDEAR